MSKPKKDVNLATRLRVAELEKTVASLNNTVQNQNKVIVKLTEAVSIGFNLEMILRNKGLITDADNEIVGLMNESIKSEDPQPRVGNTTNDN